MKEESLRTLLFLFIFWNAMAIAAGAYSESKPRVKFSMRDLESAPLRYSGERSGAAKMISIDIAISSFTTLPFRTKLCQSVSVGQ